MGDTVATATAAPLPPAPRIPTPSAASIGSTHPWVCPVPVTREMHELVHRYLMDKGLLYLGELLALVEDVEGPLVRVARAA